MRTQAVILALMVAFAAANLHSVDFSTGENELNLKVKVGDLVRIVLKENRSTGYSWKFNNPFENASGIYTVPIDDYSQQSKEGNGAAGVRTIVLKIEKAGSENFELIYVRSWEMDTFVDTARSENGSPVAMKNIPNEGYRKISINCSN